MAQWLLCFRFHVDALQEHDLLSSLRIRFHTLQDHKSVAAVASARTRAALQVQGLRRQQSRNYRARRDGTVEVDEDAEPDEWIPTWVQSKE